MTPSQSATAQATQRIVVRRVIHAPIDRVYSAWSDASVAALWSWGHEFDNISVELDCRPGGRWRQAVQNRETGVRWEFDGEFREVVPLQRVVFTFHWRSDTGLVEGPSLVRVDLTEHAEGTEVVITHTELLADKAQATQDGWEDCLTQIAAHVRH